MTPVHLAVAVVAVAGLVLRLWLTTQPLGALDADMAVLGLMTRWVLDGNLAVFHWGQAYGGAQETYVAALFALLNGGDVTTLVLQMTTIVLSGVATVFLWLLGREVVGRNAALLAACLFWIWPGPFVWWSIKIGSNYWFALSAALAFAWLVARERNHETTAASVAIIGITFGLAWWANPQTVYVLVPVVLFFRRLLWERRRWLGHVVAGAVVGAAPWITFNLMYGFPSLEAPPPIAENEGPLAGLQKLVTVYLPTIVGTRLPFSYEWIGGWPATTLAAATVIGLAVAAVGARRPPILPLLGVAMFLVLFPFSPGVHYVLQPRYAIWGMPWFVLVIAAGAFAFRMRRRPALVAMLVGAAALTSTAQLVRMNDDAHTYYPTPDVPAPPISNLVALLDHQGITLAYGDYWLSYNVIFETEERIIVAPRYTDRNRTYSALVAASASPPGHVFVETSRHYQRFIEYCRVAGLECTTVEYGGYALVKPNRLVTGPEAAAALTGPRTGTPSPE